MCAADADQHGGARAGADTGTAAPLVGWCATEVERELPELQLLSCEVEVRRRGSLTGDSPADVQERMRALSSRVRGGRAVSLRREPVPAAYRVFFRHIGIDPDVQRTPIEAAVLERMLRGGFPTGGLLEDVLLLALMDTGVPVWALGTEQLDGPLGIRTSGEAEPLGGVGPLLTHGALVVADAACALAVLFGEVSARHLPGPRTRAVTLFALRVGGVPQLYAEEALWSARTALEHE
jgi:DNA/RNA-binding domain of Phe-tRNA-synthetase-like protein